MQSYAVPEQVEHELSHKNSTVGITDDSAKIITFELEDACYVICKLNYPAELFENLPLFTLFFKPVIRIYNVDPSGISL